MDPIISSTIPEEDWTHIGSNRNDKAKKKIVFTPPNDMLIHNIFTP